MKIRVAAFLIASALCIVSSVHAVPPTYTGQFGNPEEPALRVVKWPWLGLRKFVSYTHEGVYSGLKKESLCAAGCEGADGAWYGAKTLVDHTGRGLIYAPLPPKAPLRTTMTYEDHTQTYIVAIMPWESTATTVYVDTPKDYAQTFTTTTPAHPVYLVRRVEESDVVKAQRRYVPKRVAARDRVPRGEGNLLRLAR